MVEENCQIMLFSATYDDEVMEFAQAIVPNPTIIRLKREEESLDNIKQHYVLCESEDDKYNAIANIYGGITVGQAMIFCQVNFSFLYHDVIHMFLLSYIENQKKFPFLMISVSHH